MTYDVYRRSRRHWLPKAPTCDVATGHRRCHARHDMTMRPTLHRASNTPMPASRRGASIIIKMPDSFPAIIYTPLACSPRARVGILMPGPIAHGASAGFSAAGLPFRTQGRARTRLSIPSASILGIMRYRTISHSSPSRSVRLPSRPFHYSRCNRAA